jgi:Phage terminase, small subunit
LCCQRQAAHHRRARHQHDAPSERLPRPVALCETWATYRAAIADVKKREPVVAGAIEGTVVKNPSWTVAHQAQAAPFTQLAARFGLTPVDRSRLVVERFGPQPRVLDEIVAANRRTRRRS